jgi:hypothetical protein
MQKYFYDKTIELYSYTTIVQDDGFVNRDLPTLTGVIKGNVWFGKLDQVRKGYGLSDDVDGAISSIERLELNQLVKWNGVYYIVIQSLPFDNYNLSGIKKWQNQKQVAPSV